MAEPPTQQDYVGRTNTAIDYIVKHLDEKLTLETIANACDLSPFHFHRIFRGLMGETLNQFIKRVRLERALHMMSHAPKKTLTTVALKCGFSTSSDFSRSFKQRYGMAPSAFDLSRFRDSQRQDFEQVMASYENGPQLGRLPAGENPDQFVANIKEIPSRTVAYIRVLNPYQSMGVVEACQRLVKWADDVGIHDGQWLGYMWEDPEIVPLEKCRYDAAVVIDESPPNFCGEGEIGRFDFPAMTVVEVSVRGNIELEQRALDWLYGTWLPRSAYVPDNQPAFESWIGKPFAHGMEHFEIDCQIPIRRG